MEVKPGYKKTELAIIPEDWQLKKIGSLCKIFGRIGFRGYTKKDIVSEGRGAISLSPSNIIDNKLSLDKRTYISWEKYYESPEIMIEIGDIIFVKTGSTGKTCYVDSLPEKATLNPQMVVFKKLSVNAHLLSFIFTSQIFLNQINETIVGGVLPTLSQKQIANYLIPIPTSEDEQKTIADVLNDVSFLMKKYNQLISKKYDIKKATMQKLLTGKQRLPGFNIEWKIKRLDELLKYEQPTNYLVKNSNYNSLFETPVLTAGKSFFLGYTNETNGIFKNLPVILFDDFTTASKYVDFDFKVKSSALKILLPKHRSVNLKLVFQIMQMTKFEVKEHKRHWISEYSQIQVKIPDIEEQTAIVEILSNMQNEIDSLIKLRDKTQKIKQAMIQNLLTGKIRLTK